MLDILTTRNSNECGDTIFSVTTSLCGNTIKAFVLLGLRKTMQVIDGLFSVFDF